MSDPTDQDEETITWTDLAEPIAKKMRVSYDMGLTLTYQDEPLLVIANFVSLMARKLDEHGVELPEE
jgi:hypothetical protein